MSDADHTCVAPHTSAKSPIIVNTAAITPAAKPTLSTSGVLRIATGPIASSSAETPTSIARAPQIVVRMARIVTWRSKMGLRLRA
jgi:hypothetical protein